LSSAFNIKKGFFPPFKSVVNLFKSLKKPFKVAKSSPAYIFSLICSDVKANPILVFLVPLVINFSNFCQNSLPFSEDFPNFSSNPSLVFFVSFKYAIIPSTLLSNISTSFWLILSKFLPLFPSLLNNI